MRTPALVLVACALPFVVLLCSQLRLHCVEQGDCSPAEQVGAWLLVPLIVAWLAVVGLLAVRAGRWLRTRRSVR